MKPDSNMSKHPETPPHQSQSQGSCDLRYIESTERRGRRRRPYWMNSQNRLTRDESSVSDHKTGSGRKYRHDGYYRTNEARALAMTPRGSLHGDDIRERRVETAAGHLRRLRGTFGAGRPGR